MEQPPQPQPPQQPPSAESPTPEQPQPGYPPQQPYGPPTGVPGYPPQQPYGPPAGVPGYPPQQPYGPPAGVPGYPPQPYGPPHGYPMPPASTPPGYYGAPPAGMPGYPPQPYAQQPMPPGAPYPYSYQQPPFPAPRNGPSRGLIWALVSLGVVIVVLVAVGVTALAHQGPSGNNGAATATGTALAKNTYTAAIPGPGCDTHGGIWKADFETQTQCLADSLQVSSSIIGNVIFSGTSSTGTFPRDYEVSVDVAPLTSANAGLVVHQTANDQTGYELGIDTNGSWLIHARNGKDDPQLPYGEVTAASHYILDILVMGSTETLSINGTQVKQFTATEFTAGDSVGLIAYFGTGDAQADFKNFVFKTLP